MKHAAFTYDDARNYTDKHRAAINAEAYDGNNAALLIIKAHHYPGVIEVVEIPAEKRK